MGCGAYAGMRKVVTAKRLGVDVMPARAEPAGCVGLAAYLSGAINVDEKKAAAVISGGNIDMSFMSRLVEKELFSLGHSVRIRGTILDRVGSLNKVLAIVADSRLTILEIEQDRLDPDIAPNKMELNLVLELPDKSALNNLLQQLMKNGFKFEVYED